MNTNDNYMNSITGNVRKMSDWNGVELKEGEELVKVFRNHQMDWIEEEIYIKELKRMEG